MKQNDEFQQQVRYYVELLTCRQAFIRAVEEKCADGVSYREAFEHVEDHLELVTGKRHFNDYGSFRVGKCRAQKRKKT